MKYGQATGSLELSMLRIDLSVALGCKVSAARVEHSKRSISQKYEGRANINYNLFVVQKCSAVR